AARAPSGFLARDVAAGSDYFGFQDGACPQLRLKLSARFEARPDHIAVSGRVTDTTGRDRAITLVFALPVDARPEGRPGGTTWRWDDDIRRSRPISGDAEYSNTVPVQCGSTGTISLYPLAAIRSDRAGLAIAIDMAR